MRRLMALAVLFMAIAAIGATPAATKVRFEKSYIPLFFDSNDRSQVVLAGTYPDTCYQGGGVQLQIDKINRVIRATQWAFVSPENCLPALVPFHSILDLGRLEPGVYSIEDGLSGDNLGYLPVTLAKDSGPGNHYNYIAPVSDAYVEKNPTTGQSELVLQGTWADRCTHFKEVNLFYQRDVLIVQPIVEPLNAEDSRDCALQLGRFQKRIPLRPMAERTYLLHVRTMDGNTINKIIND